MEELRGALAAIRERIDLYRGQGIGESNTKAVLIAPLFRGLGWNVEDLEEVRLEFKRRPADKPVDYALLINRVPRLFVEAKALGENLDDRRWASQIMGYAGVAGVKWVVLTDGDEYRIYNAYAEVDVEEKLFRSARVSDEASHPEETLSLLSKESIAVMEEAWKDEFVDRQVQAALEGLLSPEPEPGVVRLIRKRVPRLKPAQIKGALGRLSLRLEIGEPPATAVAGPAPVPTIRPRKEEAPPWTKVKMEELIAAGLLKPPLSLERPYKGHLLRARVENDGSVSFAGTSYPSVSTAAAMARRSIIGAPAGRKYPQTNGWTFWKFRDHDGELRLLDVLRQRLHESGPSGRADGPGSSG